LIVQHLNFHFSANQPTGRSNNSGLRTGFFKKFKQREVVVKKWDQAAEGILLLIIIPSENQSTTQ